MTEELKPCPDLPSIIAEANWLQELNAQAGLAFFLAAHWDRLRDAIKQPPAALAQGENELADAIAALADRKRAINGARCGIIVSVEDADKIVAALRGTPAEREPTDAQLIVDQQRMINQLREWRSAILAKCKASDGFDRLDWGSGDKDGWGFVHYFIGHLETRALQAEKDLALRQSPAASVDLTNHHNALICPYCNPKGLKFAEPTSSAALEPFLRFAEQNTDENGWLSSIHRESISTWFGPSEFRALLALRSQPETVSQRELAINLLGWSSSEKAAAVLLSKFNVTRKTTEEPRG